MANLAKITRRAALVGSVAIAGGVAFGYYAYQKPHPNPLKDDLGEGEAALTAYVKITPNGITLITPHCDIGQGVYSVQAALIAEELDLEFGQFDVSPGVPAAAYYNRAFAEEAAPYKLTDDSAPAQMTRALMGVALKFVAMQGTGGSSSVPDSFERLRQAGAVARETLKKAAARKHRVNRKLLTTEGGHVILPDGTRIPYTELSADAAKVSPVNDVKLRDPSSWRLLGKPMQRLDIAPKSTGTLKYGIDLQLPGMLHAAIKLNPHQGGAMNSFDAAAAEQMRGVKKVLPLTGGVAVVADNTWRAFQAAEQVRVDWGPANFPDEMSEHWAKIDQSFNEEQLDNEWQHDGDVDKAIDNADQAVEREYRAPYVAHAPLEPLSALIQVTDERADIWVSTQIPGMVKTNVALITGTDEENVFVHNQYSGGSFGHRLEDEHVKHAAEIARQFKGTPIKLTYSREEDMRHDYPRHIAKARMRGAIKNGAVNAIDYNVASVSAVTSQMSRQPNVPPIPGPDKQLIAGAWNAPYAIPNSRYRAYRVSGLAPTSSWRSVGASTNGFFQECFVDELIHEAGLDPLAARLSWASNGVAKKVLEEIGTLSNWGTPLGENRGRGLAMVASFGVPCAEVVEVTNTENGIKIDKVYMVADVGRVLDPVNFDNLAKGGVVWGLGHAMNCAITYKNGIAEQNNYHQHEGMRLNQCPEIVVRGLENSPDIRGIGEPPVPPAAPALANAIFAATGLRLRAMPFNDYIRFI